MALVGSAVGGRSVLVWASKRGWLGFGLPAEPGGLAGVLGLAAAHQLVFERVRPPEPPTALPSCLPPAAAAFL